LLSNCNGWSNSAVRNTAVPRQKNLNRPPRNCGRCRRLGRPAPAKPRPHGVRPKKWFMQVTSTTCAPRSFTSNWPREKGPAFVGGAKEIVMQRGRLGGIPLPRTIPIRDGGIGSMIMVRARLFPGGRERGGSQASSLAVMSSTRHITNIKT
jgi:hypothetical protein